MGDQEKTISILEIMELLPHRYPFLLIDKVLDYEPLQKLLALKNVTLNEPFFQGHFPGYPVMPGVLIIEALAQAGGILVQKSKSDIAAKNIFLFSGIEKAKFRHPVYPGDQLHLEVHYLKDKFDIWKMQGEAKVGDKIAAQAVLTAALISKEAL